MQYDIYAHKSYKTISYNNGDVITIAIQQKVTSFLPSKNSAHVSGR